MATDQETVTRMSKVLGALINGDISLGGATPEALVLLAGTLMHLRRKADSTSALMSAAHNVKELVPLMVEAVDGMTLNVSGPPSEVPAKTREYVKAMGDALISQHVEDEHSADLDSRIEEIVDQRLQEKLEELGLVEREEEIPT